MIIVFNFLGFSEISTANINSLFPITIDGFGIAVIKNTTCIIQVVSLYYKNSNYHSFVESHCEIDSISYISCRVFLPLQFNLFSCFSSDGFIIMCHLPPSLLLYYLGFGNFAFHDKPRGLLTLSGLALEQFQFFNQDSVKDQLKIIMEKK